MSAGRGFKYNFKMFMEGVEMPFISANVVCSPQGVEAAITLEPDESIYDLKPKTNVQIFFKDWVGSENGWRLMFDGFFSRFDKNDEANGGRGVSILCRDFRMDIRKTPACLAFVTNNELSASHLYSAAGIKQQWMIQQKAHGKTTKHKSPVRTYGGELNTAGYIIDMIAGTATGLKAKKTETTITKTSGKQRVKKIIAVDILSPIADKNEEVKKFVSANYKPSKILNIELLSETGKESPFITDVIPNAPKQRKGTTRYAVEVEVEEDITYDEKGFYSDFSHVLYTKGIKKGSSADGGFFLDAFARGLWLESVGGTSYAPFINSRIRTDKRLLIPRNDAGYSFFNRNHLNEFGGSSIMGNGMFTSVESAIMRLSGIFQASTYSCNSPALIYLGENDDKMNPYAMSERVHKFTVQNEAQDFGPPFMLNETMILPQLTFTAPPTFNILFPSMYNNINWQHDYDVDYTRGYYTQVDMFGGNRTELCTKTHEAPNSLFSVAVQGKNNPPLTIEERFKGTNVIYGKTHYMLARSIAKKESVPAIAGKNSAKEIEKVFEELKKQKINLLKNNINSIQSLIKNYGTKPLDFPGLSPFLALATLKAAVAKIERLKNPKPSNKRPTVDNVLDRHAIMKFLHARYKGRAVTVEAEFNPYLVSGFPGVVMADDNRDEYKTLRTLIGKIQQVKHVIVSEGVATTSLIMTHIRFIDEPTDMDDMGNPLYLEKTDPINAEIDGDRNYKKVNYSVPHGKVKLKHEYTAKGKKINKINKNGKKFSEYDKTFPYDWDVNNVLEDNIKTHKFAKDILMISKEGKSEGRSNLSFLDNIYTPNKIGDFYNNIFEQYNDYMIGFETLDDPNTKKKRSYSFIYNSIHEAIAKLEEDISLKNDYNKSMQYVRRNICSEEGFFFGILRASYYDETDTKYPYKTKDGISEGQGFNEYKTRKQYFGTTTKQADKLSEKRIIINPKTYMCSSILEKLPKTAFIKERREVVEKYKERVNKNAQSF